MIELLLGGIEPPKQPLLDFVTETKKEVKVKRQLTVQQKIDRDYYKCEPLRYIRKDNARCGAIRPEYRVPTPSIVAESTITPVVLQKPVTTPQISQNLYEAGQCTWFVKNMRPDLPNNLGNATDWLYNAQAQGMATGSIPQVGAVGWKYGHVVFITAVNNDGTVTYSDMNGRYIPYEIGSGTKPANYYQYIY